MGEVLLVWDADSSSSRRRSFYRKLSGFKTGGYSYEGVLDGLPDGSWDWLSGSALLVEEGAASEIRDLLEEFSRVLDWHEFRGEKVA